MKHFRWLIAGVALFGITAVSAPQLKQVLKIVGVGAAIKQFGPQLNSSLNKLVSHKDSDTAFTKVVPILSGGISSRQAIGAAQVMGPKEDVQRVQAVAQIDQDVFGREVKIRAMIPIASMDPTKLNRVEGVGVSGIVDLKL